MPNGLNQNVVPLNRGGQLPNGGGQPLPMLVPYKRWQTACERVSAALLGGERLILVTGPAGTGKSLLLDQAAKVMRAAGWSVVLRQADATPAPELSGMTLLMVDEADRLEPEALRRLATGHGPVVLAGLNSLAARVPKAAGVTLPALSREEARDYIAHWLTLTGRSPANLETAGMRRLVELSGGIPRLMSTLLGAAAWLAASAGEEVMTLVHIEESAALRSSLGPHEPNLLDRPTFETASPRSARSVILPAVAAMVLLGLGAFLAGRYFPDEMVSAATQAGRTIAHWQRELQGRIDGGLHPEGSAHTAPSPTPVAASPANSAPATAAPMPPAIASIPLPEPPPASVAPPEAAPVEEPHPPGSMAVAEAIQTPPPAVPVPELPATPPVVEAFAAPADIHPGRHEARTPPPLSSQTIDLLLRRGREMLSIGDVSAARLLFGRAADAGDGDAMLAMGETYDPVIIAESKLMLAPDRTEAARWYRRSVSAGNKQAQTLLERLGS